LSIRWFIRGSTLLCWLESWVNSQWFTVSVILLLICPSKKSAINLQSSYFVHLGDKRKMQWSAKKNYLTLIKLETRSHHRIFSYMVKVFCLQNKMPYARHYETLQRIWRSERYTIFLVRAGNSKHFHSLHLANKWNI